MNTDAVLVSAYALATQERCAEAEQLLMSCPEACNTVSGMDLLARIRYAQDRIDEARLIWQRIHAADPNNESAQMAIDALDHPIPDPPSPYRKFVIAGAIAAVLGICISIFGALNRPVPVIVAQEPRTVFVTNVVERVQTNTVVKTETRIVEVEKPVERIIEHIVTNVVDRLVEVPVVSVVTQYVDSVVAVPAQTADVVVSSNRLNAVSLQVQSVSNMPVLVVNDDTRVVSARPNAAPVKRLYCPVYVIKPGDQIGLLAQKYRFRMPDFRAVNPGVDPNHVIPGQEVKIPGFFSEEDMQK